MRMGGISVGGAGIGGVHYQQFRTTGDNASSPPAPLFGVDPPSVPKEKYMAVYYPATTDESAAASIDVAPGGEVRGIDFTIAPVPLHTVRGRVVYESNNEPAMSAHVQWVSPTGSSSVDDARGMFGPAVYAAAVQCCDGAFEIGLPSGTYTLVAAVNNLSARTTVNVGDGDVDGVVLAIGRSFNIKGRLTFEGRTPSAGERALLRISLPMDPPVSGLISTSYSTVLADGSFATAAGRGDFRVSILPMLAAPRAFGLLPPGRMPLDIKGAYVKSVRLGSADVLNGGLHLDGETADVLDVVIGTATGIFQGTVANDAKQPVPNVLVALVPDAAHRHRIDLFKSTTSDSTGRFRLDGVPPGEYIAFAFDGVEDGEWQNPDYLAARESKGVAVKIDNYSATAAALQPAGSLSER
jgi:hypothetical protein